MEQLESDNFILQSSAQPDNIRKLKEVKREKDELAKLIGDMEEFLADYGLKWAGKEGNFNYNQVNQELDFH